MCVQINYPFIVLIPDVVCGQVERAFKEESTGYNGQGVGGWPFKDVVVQFDDQRHDGYSFIQLLFL